MPMLYKHFSSIYYLRTHFYLPTYSIIHLMINFKDYPQDYCAEMKDVPATPVGSTSGANIINIGKYFYVRTINASKYVYSG